MSYVNVYRKLYVGLHTHEYGATVYSFEHNGNGFPDIDEAIEKCGAEVEQDKGECFELLEVMQDVIHLEKDDKELRFICPE